MRAQIFDCLFAAMAQRDDTFFLTGDMGINLVERFQKAYPSRFLNVGIAEQNLIGVSAGLANLGYRPFAYTISNFLVHRCYEQIRNEIGIHRYPITLLGTSAGFDNAPLGPTHHIIDDWGPLKNIPGIEIYCPSSVFFATKLVTRLLASEKPAYVRIPKGEFKAPESDEDFVMLPGENSDTLLISYGSPAQDCLNVQSLDSSVSVLICNRLSPIDTVLIAKIIKRYNKVFVVEDHFGITGLYSTICQVIAEANAVCEVFSLAPTHQYVMEVGATPAYYHRRYGFDCEGISQAISSIRD